MLYFLEVSTSQTEENWMMMGASLALAASRHVLIPDEDTQFTAGMAYPGIELKQRSGQYTVVSIR